MSNKLFVGGLSWGTDSAGLSAAFEGFGQVTDAVVITDRDSGRSRGFGFVTFSDANAANEAIRGMDGAKLDGRDLKVSLAQERAPRPPRSGGGGGGGGRDRW